ncbi:MAG: V-type ATP synthase subunit D [Clostridiales bacterium]|mgnify:FL=1|nr:V-type ATP synthase subunit D [Clostridiales bacterium]
MAELRVNPTRMELKNLKNKLATARRGHKLLKDKCDELMRRFLDIVREDKAMRQKVEDELALVHRSFATASALTSPRAMREALILPTRSTELAVSTKNLMSVVVPTFTLSEVGEGAHDMPYGVAFTSGELDAAVRELSAMADDLVKLAELEKSAQMLAQEIERTRRRVNALEYIMIPRYEVAIKGITMKLDENERGNTTRLMKVKDMMLEASIEAKRAADAQA